MTTVYVTLVYLKRCTQELKVGSFPSCAERGIHDHYICPQGYCSVLQLADIGLEEVNLQYSTRCTDLQQLRCKMYGTVYTSNQHRVYVQYNTYSAIQQELRYKYTTWSEQR